MGLLKLTIFNQTWQNRSAPIQINAKSSGQHQICVYSEMGNYGPPTLIRLFPNRPKIVSNQLTRSDCISITLYRVNPVIGVVAYQQIIGSLTRIVYCKVSNRTTRWLNRGLGRFYCVQICTKFSNKHNKEEKGLSLRYEMTYNMYNMANVTP